MNYKTADKTDIDTIFRLNKCLIDQYENIESIDYEEVLSWVQRKIEIHIEEYTCIILRGEKAGYYRFYNSNGKMEIDDLYVFPQYQNLGIGTEILNKCMCETNLPIFFYVFKGNNRAIALYERLGFKIIETIEDSRYIMEKSF